MNKRRFAELTAERMGVSYREGYRALSAVLAVVEDQLKSGGQVPLTGIGILEPVARNGYQAHSPRTMEKVAVPPRTVVRFRQSKALRRRMNPAEDVEA